jgi:nucleotide-sensitive chloride channel 1A
VVWLAREGGLGLELRYKQIVMHAISRDGSASARPCIYLQLDEGSEDMAAADDVEGEEDENDDQVPAELHLVPDDAAAGGWPCAQ